MAPYIFLEAARKGNQIKVFNFGKQLRDFTFVADIVDGVYNTILSYEIFNSAYYQNMERGNNSSKVKSGAILMTNDNTKLIEYANRLTHIKNSLKNVAIPIIDTSTKIAVGLMKELELKYHLKD